MTSLERFIATIERRPVDRPACWLGFPDKKAIPGLLAEFGAVDMADMKRILDDDIVPVEIPYHSPVSDAIYAAFDFRQGGKVDADHRTLTAEGCFADCEDISEVDDFDWPEPEKYMDPALCRAAVDAVPDGKCAMAMMWSAHFQDALAAFGMENAMVKMITDPEIYEAVDARLVDFYLRAGKVFYEATRGKLHAVLIGNDMGGQNCLMLSPEMIRRFVLPGARKLIEQAKSYGLKVIYHSCGAIEPIIPDLIDAGVDAIHPIQALAKGMSAEELHAKYAGKVSFCGGVDTQQLLVHGTKEQVYHRVSELRSLFPTGLIVSPSHEAILTDVDPANVRAVFEAAGSLKEL